MSQRGAVVTERIFDGLKVIDCASFIAGPAAATVARALPGVGDHPSAMGTYGAIVTALYQRERTGKGNYVSSSLLANGLWANGCSVQAALCGDRVVPQPPREQAINALRVHYQCRDGRWLLLSIASDEWRWDKFKACLDDAALDDPRFATIALREAGVIA